MSQAASILIRVNGEAIQAASGLRIPAVLESIGLNPERVVVERNGEALTRAEAAGIVVEEGDQLEVVRIVAGG